MINLLRLVEAQQFAGEPEQKPGDQVRGTDKAVVKGKQHPFHDRLVGEDTAFEDVLSKKYQDFKELQAKEKEEKEKEKQDVAEGTEDRRRFIRFNIWTVMDGDEEVMQHPVEGDPFFSAKKFMRDLDDEGYEFTHVVSPEGRVTYLPQFDPRNFPKDEMDEGVVEAKADYNFSIEDLKRLERIRDLPTLKAQAFELISKPSAKPMKPEKVEWFKGALERMNSPMKVIKLMYDLMLSGEGHSVIGTKSSMNPNVYRQRFGEQEATEDQLDEIDRRGFLKGVGAAAVGGAASVGGKVGYDNYKSTRWDRNDQDYDDLDKEHKRKGFSLPSNDGTMSLLVEPNDNMIYLFVKDNSIEFNSFSQLRMKIDNNPAETINNVLGGGAGFHFKYPANKIVNADKILFQVAFLKKGETGRDPQKQDYKIISFVPGQQKESVQQEATEAGNPADKISMDVPLLIRIMEYAREDAVTDMDLHDVAEKLIKLSAGGNTLNMSDYDAIVGVQTEQQVNELGATPIAPPQGTATAQPAPAATAGNTADGSISPDEQTALNKINQNPAMKQQLDKLMTQATPGGASAPMKLDQDQQDALNKIKANAGLGTQYAKLIKQANPAANTTAVKP